MANKDLISLFIERFLRKPSYSVYKTEFRGMLHATKPALSPIVADAVYRKLPDLPIATSFVRVSRAIGIRGIDSSTKTAIKWAQLNTKLLSGITPQDQESIVDKYSRMQSELIMPGRIVPGLFYTYKYRAESVKDYDRYPMTLVLSRTQDSMIGMNFHYLPYQYRFALFEAIMPLIVPIPVDQLSRINITYNALTGGSFEGSQPTIKKYLFSRFKSNAVFISPVEWAVAMAYPSQEFVGKTERVVWRNSVNSL